MLRPLVAILPGPSLPPMTIALRPDVAIARFDSVASLLERAATEPATCIVADGATLDAQDVAAVRAACPDATVCVVGCHPVAAADALIAPDDDLPDRLAALVRFALGEPMRCGPRMAATGVLRMEDGRALPILDISEGGVRTASPPADIVSDGALRIEIDEGPTVAARGREIRRSRSAMVVGLHGLVGRDRTALRRWMLSHRSACARVTHPPRASAPMVIRTRP
jgi:hypothetical protein